MTDEEVEVVAREIHAADEPGKLSEAPEAHRRFCYDAARAAITALDAYRESRA